MRLALVLVLACACGDNKKPSKPHDGGIDAFQLPALPACATPVTGSTVTTREIGQVVGAALLATSPPRDPRLFVLEMRGAIRIFKDDKLMPDPFLDLSVDAGGPVISGYENGLLGLAFHPHYEANGLFYIFYTANSSGDPNFPQRDVLARCHVSATDPDRADPKSCVDVLSIGDRASNHNAGMIEFGDDGFLYISTGDGGGGGDPWQTAQDTHQLLGKILRIDVDHKDLYRGYGVPADNPFGNEVWMLGLRNPWRWSFDRGTGDMWIADVGQNAIEELSVLRKGKQRGANLGWSVWEGSRCFHEPCDRTGIVFPQDERGHDAGWLAIIGGQVYRGTCYPDLVGWYFYTDNGRGGLVKARLHADDTLEIVELSGEFPRYPASLHADARGELYITNTEGFVYHVEAGP